MKNIQHMSKAELAKFIQSSQEELKRRDNIDKATKEIRRILSEYSISIHDIDLKVFSSVKATGRSNKMPKLPKNKDKRRSVIPKYKAQNGSAQWSGRGRAPKWVVEICESEGIDIKTFKQQDRFKC